MSTRMLQRRGTAAEAAAANPVLGDGEVGWERDTKVIKIGDGVTAWNDLPSAYVRTNGGDIIVADGPNVVPLALKGAVDQIEDLFTVETDGGDGVRINNLGVIFQGPDRLATITEVNATFAATIADYTAGINAANAAAIPKALADAKGDMLVATADNVWVRVPVGGADQVWTADPAQAAGAAWKTPVSGGVGFAEIFLHGGN